MKCTDILRGKLVTLKPLNKDYFEEIFCMFSPIVRTILRLSVPGTFEETSQYLNNALQSPEPYLYYCIFDHPSGKLIGGIEIRAPGYFKGQLGSWLNEQFWGGGRYQEALHLLFTYYFSVTTEDSIDALVVVENVRSLKAHQKAGFEIVATIPAQDSPCDNKVAYKLVLTRSKFAQMLQK